MNPPTFQSEGFHMFCSFWLQHLTFPLTHDTDTPIFICFLLALTLIWEKSVFSLAEGKAAQWNPSRGSSSMVAL